VFLVRAKLLKQKRAGGFSEAFDRQRALQEAFSFMF
jgi:hypothetical protein